MKNESTAKNKRLLHFKKSSKLPNNLLLLLSIEILNSIREFRSKSHLTRIFQMRSLYLWSTPQTFTKRKKESFLVEQKPWTIKDEVALLERPLHTSLAL